MSSGQILPKQLAFVKDGSRNIPLKFGQNYSCDIPDIWTNVTRTNITKTVGIC